MTVPFEIALVVTNAISYTLWFGLLMDVLLRENVPFKRIAYSFLVMLPAIAANTWFGLRNSVIGTLTGLIMSLCFVLARYRYPIGKTLLWGFIMFVITLICDVLGSLVFVPLMGAEFFEKARTYQDHAASLLITNGCSVFAGIAAVVIVLLRGIFHPDRHQESGKSRLVWLFIRPALLIIADIWAFGQAMSRIRSQHVSMIWTEVLSNYALLIVLLIVSFTYIIQDIRYIQQYRRKETLENEKMITDALLKNMRVFRHNVANMLYGFEGYILSGKTDEMQDYYREIVRRCSLINNENIIMLQNIPSQAVVGLLIHHIDKCTRKEIPVTIYADRYLKWSGLRDTDACEVLGVLLDNAYEATEQSASPMVQVEMRNVDDAMEVIVRNTVDEKQVTDFLRSTKAGHSGIGLDSARAVLEKNNAYLNIRRNGVYVEAQILSA